MNWRAANISRWLRRNPLGLAALVLGAIVLAGAGLLTANDGGPADASAAPTYKAFVPLAARDQPATGAAQAIKVLPPAHGIYHAAFPDFDGTEDVVTAGRIREFTELAGKPLAWAYFSNNWMPGITFPAASVKTIHDAGIVPFIRMMPRSTWDEGEPDPVYSMQAIIDGRFDTQLTQWARDAKATGYALMVEFGTEVNGDWFPWNGAYNGGDPAGPRRFRDAYRHIIGIFRHEAVTNVTWVFHVDAQASPEAAWNAMRNYYPGDDYIDWLGISAYGAQTRDEDWQSFVEVLDSGYAELAALSPSKPMALLEFAVTDGYPGRDKAAWVRDAIAAVASGRYPRLKAISYWHEDYENDGAPPTLLRIDSTQAVLNAYRAGVANPLFTSTVQLGTTIP